MRPLLSVLPLILLCAPLAEAKKKKAAPAPPPAKPIPVELQNSVCTITGDVAGGTGFIATFKGKTVIATNQHVIFGQKELRIRNSQGTDFKPNAGLVATEADIALLFLPDPLPEGIKPFVLCENVTAVAKEGDEITIVGNSAIGGTLTSIGGHLKFFGPVRLEHDAPIVGGTSGGPVFHHASGQVVALNTEGVKVQLDREVDRASASKEGTVVKDGAWRLYGHRVDTQKSWIDLEWKSINSVEDQIAKLKIAVEDAVVIIEKGSWKHVQDEFLRKKLEESHAKFRSTSASEMDAYNLWIKAIDSARTSMTFKLKQLEPQAKTYLHQVEFAQLKPQIEDYASILEIVRDDATLMKSIYAGKYKMPERARVIYYRIRR